ncbi:MAG: dienelactone hydrolase family protein [Pirellulales bacterium]
MNSHAPRASPNHTGRERFEKIIRIPLANGFFEGSLAIPTAAVGAVIFAHGSGSSRHSPRNQFVAEVLHRAGLATLLVDLLTEEEEQRDAVTAQHRFDIPLLAGRLSIATEWMQINAARHDFRYGYFGASTGAAAALVASTRERSVAAIVSRGGRPDLAGASLQLVRAATLLLVGGRDGQVIDLNRAACNQLHAAAERELRIIPGATHLFPEPGKLEQVAAMAAEWFVRHLSPTTHAAAR